MTRTKLARVKPGLIINAFLAVVIVLTCSPNMVMSCPSACLCKNRKVVCANQHLMEIPLGIPDDTMALDLRSNNLREIKKSSLSHLVALESLILKNNQISEIEEGVFDKMPLIKGLDLSVNSLVRFPKNVFIYLTELTSLDLSQNSIESIDGIFATHVKLFKLVIDQNKISSLSENAFTNLPRLVYLLLGTNKISEIHPKAFAELKKLSYLVLKGNPIKNVNNLFKSNTRLSYIDLSSCQLTDIPAGLPWVMRYLQLRNNKIKKIYTSSLVKYRYVGIVVLDQNEIEWIEGDAFTHIRYLGELWLNGNKLTKLPALLPPKVKALHVSANQIKDIPAGIYRNNKFLKLLSLNKNQITKLNKDTFKMMTSIQKLYLSSNDITDIEDYTFSDLISLQEMSLSSNPITALTTETFTGLKMLNKLELVNIINDVDVENFTFLQCPALQVLDLKHSNLLTKKIINSKSILKSMAAISEINLKNTKLTTLPSFFAEYLKNSGKIHLTENEWHCDLRIKWLAYWIKRFGKLFEDSAEIKCFTPKNLQGRQLVNLSDDEFADITTTSIEKPVTKSVTALSAATKLTDVTNGNSSRQTATASRPSMQAKTNLETESWAQSSHPAASVSIAEQTHNSSRVTKPETITATSTPNTSAMVTSQPYTTVTVYSQKVTGIDLMSTVKTTEMIPQKQNTTYTRRVHDQTETMTVQVSRSNSTLRATEPISVTKLTGGKSPVSSTATINQMSQNTETLTNARSMNTGPTIQSPLSETIDYNNNNSNQDDMYNIRTVSSTKARSSTKTTTRATGKVTSSETKHEHKKEPGGQVSHAGQTNNSNSHDLSSPSVPSDAAGSSKENSGDGNSGNITVIAVATSVSVFVLILILIVIIYFLLRHRRRKIIFHRAIKYNERTDYVYIMDTSTEIDPSPKPLVRPAIRKERTSVSSVMSVPNEDITNEDSSMMKVYLWDDDDDDK